jgi:peptidoglycan/xylan/chitin deacetylase (PgdA/CDA1 family)
MRFSTGSLSTADQFYAYLKATFDTLYEEGATLPRMMSIGLHCRLAGRPGRAAGLAQFMEYLARHSNVWICRRIDIARHWHATQA